MAIKTTVILVDDLDGTELDTKNGETVRFALDGAEYEIDLSIANSALLREAIAPYIAAGRKAARGAKRPAKRVSGGSSRAAQIRAWAEANGMSVAPRGRVPAEIVAQYEAAN